MNKTSVRCRRPKCARDVEFAAFALKRPYHLYDESLANKQWRSSARQNQDSSTPGNFADRQFAPHHFNGSRHANDLSGSAPRFGLQRLEHLEPLERLEQPTGLNELNSLNLTADS